jgi:hypothetical protein
MEIMRDRKREKLSIEVPDNRRGFLAPAPAIAPAPATAPAHVEPAQAVPETT